MNFGIKRHWNNISCGFINYLSLASFFGFMQKLKVSKISKMACRMQVDEHFNSVGHLSIVTHKNIIQQILMKPQYPQHLSCEFPFTARSPPIWAHWSPLLLRIWWNHSSRTSLTASISGSQECWVINVILLINHKNRLVLFHWYIKSTSYSIFYIILIAQ